LRHARDRCQQQTKEHSKGGEKSARHAPRSVVLASSPNTLKASRRLPRFAYAVVNG
jgi:hypothetical protein